MSESRFTAERHSHSVADTFDLGRALGRALKPGEIVLLDGTLGAGKTVLTQGLAAGLDIADDIISPTYVICIPYKGRLPMWHVDAYRIANEVEVFELGLEEAHEEGVVLVIEWGSKLDFLLPEYSTRIEIGLVAPDNRLIQIDTGDPELAAAFQLSP